MDSRECLKEAVRDRGYCRELVDTLIRDIEEMSSAHLSELATDGNMHVPSGKLNGSTLFVIDSMCL